MFQKTHRQYSQSRQQRAVKPAHRQVPFFSYSCCGVHHRFFLMEVSWGRVRLCHRADTNTTSECFLCTVDCLLSSLVNYASHERTVVCRFLLFFALPTQVTSVTREAKAKWFHVLSFVYTRYKMTLHKIQREVPKLCLPQMRKAQKHPATQQISTTSPTPQPICTVDRRSLVIRLRGLATMQ